jgi:hypothetical protein
MTISTFSSLRIWPIAEGRLTLKTYTYSGNQRTPLTIGFYITAPALMMLLLPITVNTPSDVQCFLQFINQIRVVLGLMPHCTITDPLLI